MTHLTRRLLVATHNKGKAREYAEILGDLGIAWLTLDEAGVSDDVAETEDTFRGNAVLKATAYAQQTGLLTLADDSGLEVDALGGRPGVLSARYGGPGTTAVDRYQLLLAEASVTATENAVMAAVLAPGETVIDLSLIHILPSEKSVPSVDDSSISYSPHSSSWSPMWTVSPTLTPAAVSASVMPIFSRTFWKRISASSNSK